jgi:hypothetical protein
MKTLKFKHHLAEQILNGTKTVTWRLFDDKDLQAGDLVEFIDSDEGNTFGQAEIIKIREKKLGKIEEQDFDGHETYESPDEMLKHYKGYYGDRVTLETSIKIIEFKLLK